MWIRLGYLHEIQCKAKFQECEDKPLQLSFATHRNLPVHGEGGSVEGVGTSLGVS